MTTLSGTIQAVAEVRTRTEPAASMSLGSKPGGQTINQDCGDYTNTGNVPQTVTIAVSGETKCTVANPKFSYNGAAVVGNTVTIAPTKTASFKVDVTLAPATPGAGEVAFSFMTTPTWS